MIFELLRTHKVDVMRYLPQFLANDASFKLTQDTLSTEHEKLRLTVIDIARQFFVETATWGLDDWERIYNIVPVNKLDLEDRRERLLQKIRGASTVTYTRMQDLIDSVVPTKDARLLENVAPGVFRIEMETIAAVDEVRAIVDFYKPAHLTCIISHMFHAPASPQHIAGAVSECDTTLIPFAKGGDIETEVRPLYFGGAVSVCTIDILEPYKGDGDITLDVRKVYPAMTVSEFKSEYIPFYTGDDNLETKRTPLFTFAISQTETMLISKE